MTLDEETIKRLTEKRAPARSKPAQDRGNKKSRKGYMGIRIQTQYPKLIRNDFVKGVPGTERSSTMGCTSFGCGAPSYYLFLDQPLCSIHLTYALVYELQRIKGDPTSGEEPIGSGADANTPTPLLEDISSPLVIVNSNTNGSEHDDDSYL